MIRKLLRELEERRDITNKLSFHEYTRVSPMMVGVAYECRHEELNELSAAIVCLRQALELDPSNFIETVRLRDKAKGIVWSADRYRARRQEILKQ